MKELVAVNGRIFSPEKATISVFDRGFLYGDSVYEVARSYNRVFFAFEDHIERLFNSASRISLSIGCSQSQLMDEIYRIYEHSSIDNAYMRLVVTRGEGPIGLDPGPSPQPHQIVFVRSLEQVSINQYESGISVITSSVQRNGKKNLDPNIKSGNYLNNVMAYLEAKERKAQDAILVSQQGYVAEATLSNVFMVTAEGTIVGVPDEGDILFGITRKILRQICRAKNLPYIERFFTPDELRKASEVFLTGSVKEILPVCQVDGVSIGSGKPGAITKRLWQFYKETVAEYLKKKGGSL